MRSASEILKFNFSTITFLPSANEVIPSIIIHQIGNRIAKLKSINDKIVDTSFAFEDDSLKSRTFLKFKESFSNNKESFTKRELRALIFGLDYSENNLNSVLSNELEIDYALNLLDLNWRDSFLKGLVLFVLKNWESKHYRSMDQLRNFVSQRIETYSSNNKQLLNFKRIQVYFNVRNGDEVLGLTLARMNKPIHEATQILGVPESWFSFPYFSRVIISYYEKINENIIYEIDNLNEILIRHNNSITNKRLVSKIIIKANEPEFFSLQEKVKNIALKRLGDPNIDLIWAVFDNASETEKQELISSRKILNEWITKKFINIFFEKCILDERRKKFWLGYASEISSFKVYGPIKTEILLKQDERISEIVDKRFETVLSNRNVSAFIFYIENYMLIEFSKKDYAFYAYNLDSNSYPKITKQLNSVDDLLDSNFPFAIKREGGTIIAHCDEGRFSHSDGFFKNGEELRWEQVFDWWIKEYLIE